jgi:beta-xylosidase
MMKLGSTYYWYGDSFAGGISLYTSPDLVHWTYVKLVLQMGGWTGRPDVLYNESTQKYVLILEVSTSTPRNSIEFATADAPDGDFQVQNVVPEPNAYTMGDHSTFKDTDGKAYLVYTYDESYTNGYQGISELAADYLSIGNQIAAYPAENGSCEADSLLHVGNTYYWFTSACAGWDSSPTYYRTSTDLMNFSAVQAVTMDPPSDNSFDTQEDFVIPIVGTTTTSYVYVGDRYSQFTSTPPSQGQNAFYPLTFDQNGVPTVHGDATWSVDVYTGEWKTP